MKPVIVPPLVITQGQPFAQSWRIEDPLVSPPVVSLAGWSGTFRLFHQPFDGVFHTAPVAIVNDRIVVEIPAETTAGFSALPFIGGRANGWYQITLSAPDPLLNQVWQGAVSIAGVAEE
jgi:hypothetical protein